MKAIYSFIAAIIFLPSIASAGPLVNLNAQVSSKLPNDEMVVTVGAVRSGQNVAALNEAVLADLNYAVKTAKAVPGVKAQLGSVYTSQDWREGHQVGWQVSGEVVLTSQDIPALATLAGNLGQKLQLRGVNFQLSEAKRRAEETRLLGEAASAFRTKSAAAAQAFGYQKYEIEELAINPGEPSFPRPMALKSAGIASTAAPLPAEGGTSEVTITVTGRVRMN
jgi:predicted secreted protein